MNDNGNTSSYTYSPMNQYVVNGAAYSYDGNFNLASAPDWVGGFDAQNQLMSAGHDGNAGFFTCDGLGRCVRRIVYAPNGSSNTVLYTYDGWKPVEEWDGAGNPHAWNIYGAGADEILWRHSVRGGDVRYHHDRHGNVTTLLGPNGEGFERYTYDAFGKPKITHPRIKTTCAAPVLTTTGSCFRDASLSLSSTCTITEIAFISRSSAVFSRPVQRVATPVI